jgi:hypothetical protein
VARRIVARRIVALRRRFRENAVASFSSPVYLTRLASIWGSFRAVVPDAIPPL